MCFDSSIIRSQRLVSDIVNKIGISYYLTQDDFDAASEISRQLIDRNETEANYVLYTDVLAQSAYSRETEKLAETTDSEILPLVKNALSHYETAMSANGTDIEAIETNAEEAEHYYGEARGVYYQRLINFLELKKNQGFDKDGIISLELIKLKILKEDYETAFNEVKVLLERIENLDMSSPIREDLILVRESGKKMKEEGLGSEDPEFLVLCEKVSALLDNASCMIFTYGEDNINGKASKVLASMIYDGLPSLIISGADASRYPRTEIDFSLNLRKQSIIGGPGEYYADDFTFTDQGEPASDCKLSAHNGYSGRSAVMVLDLQNAGISNDELAELQNALYSLTDNCKIADKFAFVNSSSYIQSELTNNVIQTRYSIRNINSQYAVSAYTCLNTAMDLLEQTGREDDRVIVYVSNGSSLTEEELLSSVNRAASGNIRIYSIAIGKDADTNAGSLSHGTGGVCIQIPYYEQLTVFMNRLSDLMNYRYTAQFTATADSGNTDNREFTALLNSEGVSDTIAYSGGGA